MNSDQTSYMVIDAGCDCRSCREWMRVFGVDHVAILNPRPVKSQDRHDQPASFVRVDVRRLPAKSLANCVCFASEEFGLDIDVVRARLADPAHGYPIRLGPGRVVCEDPETGRALLRFRRAALDRMGAPR